MVSGMAVPYPEDVVLVWFQTGEGQAFEVVHQLLFLLWRDRVFRPPGADPGRELPFAVLGVDDVAGHVGISTQKCRRRIRSTGVIHPQKVIYRAAAAALTVGKNFYVHVVSVIFLMSDCRASRRMMISRASI